MGDIASSSVGQPAELETWDYLAHAQGQKRRMLNDIQKIYENCPKDPGHRKVPVSKCKDCYHQIVDRIKQRYLGNPGGEWYAERRIFIQHLTELIAAVRRGESKLDAIEDRVMDEKRKWFREGVKKWAATFASFGLAEKREELLRLHDDRTLEFADFCDKVQKLVEVNVEGCPPDSLKRLLNPKLKKSERTEAYIQIFFFPTGKPEVIMEYTQRYLNMLDQGMSMRRIIATMVEDRRQYVGHSAELDTIKQRIDDLQKAKATFQKQQQEKRQRKNGKAPEPERGPPCAVCGTAVELQHRICPVCEISVTYGIAKEPHAYCSEKCQNGDFFGHVEDVHQCYARDNCIQLYEDVKDDEYGHFCKQCLDSRTAAGYYCSMKCAKANHTDHRDEGVVQVDEKPVFLSIPQIFRELQDSDVLASHYFEEIAPDDQLVSAQDHTTTESDAMDGLEMQSVGQQAGYSAPGGKRDLAQAEPVRSSAPIDAERTESVPATLNQVESIDMDTDMRDVNQREPSPRPKPTNPAPGYQWGQNSRQLDIPVHYTPKKVEPRSPIFPEAAKEDDSNRRSPEPEPKPGKVTELFPEKVGDAARKRSGSAETVGLSEGKLGPANIPSTGAGAAAEKMEDYSRRFGGPSAGRRPDEARSGFTGAFGNRAEPRRDPPRKVIPSVESQYSRFRHDDQRRPFDRDSPSRNDEFRKRKPDFLQAEPRQFDRDNRDPKRARSGSDELEEGEI